MPARKKEKCTAILSASWLKAPPSDPGRLKAGMTAPSRSICFTARISAGSLQGVASFGAYRLRRTAARPMFLVIAHPAAHRAITSGLADP
jgi:hypothetical protein